MARSGRYVVVGPVRHHPSVGKFDSASFFREGNQRFAWSDNHAAGAVVCNIIATSGRRKTKPREPKSAGLISQQDQREGGLSLLIFCV